MNKIDCFTAAIVKGIVESDDATKHFGSLLGFDLHKQIAVRNGLITEDERVTAFGMQWYAYQNLKGVANTRAYFSPPQDWEDFPLVITLIKQQVR